MLLANKAALKRRGGIPAIALLTAEEEKPPLSLHTLVNSSWQRLPWFCFQCSENVSVVELSPVSPRRAELASRNQSPCCSITGLEAPPPPPSPTPLPSACLLYSPVGTTLILGNVSCWFIFYVILFLFGRIYIYKYIDIYHYRIMHW